LVPPNPGELTYDYCLHFTNNGGYGFTFYDESGDSYFVTTLRNGDHYFEYNSAKPNIIGVE